MLKILLEEILRNIWKGATLCGTVILEFLNLFRSNKSFNVNHIYHDF